VKEMDMFPELSLYVLAQKTKSTQGKPKKGGDELYQKYLEGKVKEGRKTL